jgi:hypothetical protein
LLVGRSLYILGLIFVFISVVVIVLSIFSIGGNLLYAFFGLLNGLIAIGVGDLVIDLNHRKRLNTKTL